MNNLPIVAIVGEPNSGKSTLLNKICSQKLSIATNVPGTTRDRQYGQTMWNNAHFMLVDTAGLEHTPGELEDNVRKQIDIAKEEADILLFVADGKLLSDSIDRKTLLYFRKTKKPILLCVNKIDSPSKIDHALNDYKSLGIKKIFPISSVTGLGIGDALDEIVTQIKELGLNTEDEEEKRGIKISLVGKPNVGKSTIFNSILGQERAVVSNVPGTTRAPIDTQITIGETDFVFIDTAGLKRSAFKSSQPDYLSSIRTWMSIKRSDIVFVVLDATIPISKQDMHIAGRAAAEKKGVIVLANKADMLTKEEQITFKHQVADHLPFLWMCPIFMVSGKDNKGFEEVITASEKIYENRNKETTQEDLDKLLYFALKHNPPKQQKDQKEPKVKKLVQEDTSPPVFSLSVNASPAVSDNFRKYLHNLIITKLDYFGTNIILRIDDGEKKHTSTR